MSPEELRLECVRLLLASRPQHARNVVAEARVLVDFIAGTHDAEIIGAAHEFAGKVRDATG